MTQGLLHIRPGQSLDPDAGEPVKLDDPDARKLHRKAAAIAIGKDSVSFELEGEAHSIPCKQVIIAMGAQPDGSMLAQLTTRKAQLHRIGDCREVGYIDGAILDARKLVQEIA